VVESGRLGGVEGVCGVEVVVVEKSYGLDDNRGSVRMLGLEYDESMSRVLERELSHVGQSPTIILCNELP
jgi:hypothetical protein